jgi:hypothetical protein
MNAAVTECGNGSQAQQFPCRARSLDRCFLQSAAFFQQVAVAIPGSQFIRVQSVFHQWLENGSFVPMTLVAPASESGSQVVSDALRRAPWAR